MGIIKKQSIFSTVILYAGFVVGIFNNVILLPKTLSIDQLGLVSVLFGLSSIFYSYSSFGIINIINKFSNYYKNYLPYKKNDLLSLSLFTAIIASTLLTGVYILFQEKIFSFFHYQDLLLKYKNYVPLSGAFLLVQSILSIYTNTYYKTIWTNFIKEVVFRLYNTFLILLLLFRLIDFELYLKLYLCSYIFTSFLLTLYLIFLRKFVIHWKPSGLTKKLWPNMWKMGLISWSGDIVFSIGLQIDVLVTQSVLGSAKTGYYTFVVGFAVLIMAPQRALINISFPVLADSWRRKDMKNIRMIYQKSANNMLLAGGLVFLIITLNTHSIFDLVNKKGYYSEYFLSPSLVILLGIARLIELGTGVNASIIYTSRKISFWLVDFISSIFIIIAIIFFNYFLAKEYGIVGIGVAAIFAYSLHNGFRMAYIYYKIKMHPLSVKMLKTVLAIIAVYFVERGLEYFLNGTLKTIYEPRSYIKILLVISLRSTLILTMYILLAHYLRISEEAEILRLQISSRIKRIIKFK